MLEIGWAGRDITPPRPAMIQGQKHRRIGESAIDPLTVTAWAMSGEEDSAVLVSCDLAFPSEGLIEAVRRGVGASTVDFAPEAVVLVATHTHTSLVLTEGLYDHPGGEVMTPTECEAFVAERIIDAIAEAWSARRPRRVRRAFGHAVVGHNRYAVYSDGSAKMYGSTDREDFAWIGGYEDHSFDLLAVYEEDGDLAGLALALPCPAQVDESLEVLSADYWHETREGLRRRFGPELSVLGLCAAAGDQSPHFLLYGELEQEMRDRRGITERQEIADRVVDGVERALVGATKDLTGPFIHRIRTPALTPRAISREDRDCAAALYKEAEEAGQASSWFPARAKRVVETFDGPRPAEPVSTEIHVIRIGDSVLATNQFELFLDYSLAIKARSSARQTVIVQLAGRGFYLPSPRAVAGGSYGAFPVVSAVGPEGGAELVEETLSAIGEVFA